MKTNTRLASIMLAFLVATATFARTPEFDLRAQLDAAKAALAAAPSASTHLAVADAHRALFQLDAAIANYQAAANLDKTPKAVRAQIHYLLALGLFDQAQAALDSALNRFVGDGILLEQRAVLAAGRGEHDDAVLWLERSWDAGRHPLAFLEQGRIAEHLYREPYRSLVAPDLLVHDLASLAKPALEQRLRLVAGRLDAGSTAQLVGFLATQTDAGVLRLGLDALNRLEDPATEMLTLLTAKPAQVRRATLIALWAREDLSRYRAAIAEREQDADLGNADLAVVLGALIDANGLDLPQAERVLRGVGADNSYRHLALTGLAQRFQAAGDAAAAAGVNEELAALDPKVAAARSHQGEALARYWECMERSDLSQMRELLYHHQFIERIDARVYGLPRNDFDDQKNLTIPERLFLRAYYRQLGNRLPVEGPIQYPREIRHTLRKFEIEQGKAVDCSGHLADIGSIGAKALQEDGTEVKVEEDTNVDNEVNISVNPFDPRYVIVTSNDYDGVTGNDLNRSSNWGGTWTGGDVAVTGNCCDPVTQYTRTNVSGTPTNVAYHSTLVSAAGGGFGSRLLYSTDNGATWSDCGFTIGANRDRQDHAIDSNSSSACYNKIYLGHHSGTQYVATSTGATFPYCQSFTEVSTGIGSTIGSAIVISTNGTAHNFFTQYGTPGGVYQTTTTNCGSSWGAATKLANITNAGTFEWPIPSTCSRQVYRYPQAGTDTHASSAFRNNIYVTWNDLSSSCTAPGCNGNTTCNNDVYLLIGTPNNRTNPTSWTWTSRNLTDGFSDDFTDEFYPSLSVDPANGDVYISYYRTNSGASSITPRKTQVHYVVTKSIDGGATFSTPYQITNSPTDESGAGANAAMQWGDYTWNDVVNGVTYAAWTDRREGADEDVWASKVCSEPTHWSERAPTYTAPATNASNTGGLNYSVTWTAPDIYWGDGDENNTARKYQLWVDGALSQDNLLWTSTSTSYTAPDSNSHTLQIRAVNQCGVSKSYASASIGSGGGNTAPVVNITAPANGSSFNQGVSVNFTGTATDTQDGTISANLAWTSSINGSIGSGASFSTSTLSVGSHTITASVTDSGGLPGSAQISITINSTGTVLQNGVPVTGLSGATGSNTFYTMSVPSGATNLSFVTSGGTGDVDLYVRFGSPPTTSTFDCSSTSATNSETCSFATPSAGTYHVLLYGFAAYSGVQLVGSYTAPGGPVTVTFTSTASEDGRLWESTETSNVGGGGNSTDNTTASLRVGDFSDDTQYKTLVSFDTSSIPDTATITAATLRLKRGTVSGTSPFSTHGTCTVDIRTGGFGGANAFAGSDFEAAATATGVASMSNATTNGTFSTGTLNATGRGAVNKTGVTQFKVYFTLDDNDDLGTDYMGFYSGEAAAGNKPELVITYTP